MTSTPNQSTSNDGEDFRIFSFAPPTSVEEVIDISEQREEEEQPIALTEGNPPLMSNSELAQDLLQAVLLAEHARNHPSPPQTEGGQTLNPSPTPTEDNMPDYPYRPFLGDEEDDIPTDVRTRPYLAAQTNRTNGDPRLVGTEGANAPVYDEGPLNALPRPWMGGEEDQGVQKYNIGEDAYLDPDFLKALGTTDDRGLAAEGLRLVQLDGEFRYLKHWEKKLANRERANVMERGELIRKQNEATKKQQDIYGRLRGARAAARLERLLPLSVVGAHTRREGCRCRHPFNLTQHPHQKENDDKYPESVIGAESVTCSTDIMEGIANIPMSGAPTSPGDDASCLPTMRSTIPTSSTQMNVLITGTTMTDSYEETTLEEE